MVDKRLRRKNSAIEAISGRALTRAEGVNTSSVLVNDIFSRIDLSKRIKPIRKALIETNSPTWRTRRLER